jgi:hypothetical protein
VTTTADDIGEAFAAALLQDAGGEPAAVGPPTAPAPPRKPDPAEASARAAPKPRPAKQAKADAKPRTAPPEPEEAPLPAGKYAEGLAQTGEMVWLVASLNQGVKLGPVRLPDTRAYAALFRTHIPALASTWGEAARQNASVRRVVGRFAGDGGGSWVLGVAFSSAMLAMSVATLARAENAELRAQLAAQNDQAVQAYLQQMAESLGLDT